MRGSQKNLAAFSDLKSEGKEDMPQDNRKAEIEKITEQMEAGIKDVFDSKQFKEYLTVMSKFHNYSLNNTLLIAMQKPDASHIAGYTAWKKNFGRNVKKGEKGIRILAPAPYKVIRKVPKVDPNTKEAIVGSDGKPITEEKEIKIPAFKVVSVFDVSQTEGKEIPNIVTPLLGDIENYKEFFAALERISPVSISFENIKGGAHGYYHLTDNRIAIDEGMSELQTLKTVIHEIAHAKLHNINRDEMANRPDRRTREVEAEGIAYTVCRYFGLDTSDYSFNYLASWSSGKELSELKGSLETIRSTASELITGIEAQSKEIQRDRENEKKADISTSEKRKIGITSRESVMSKISTNKEIIRQQERKNRVLENTGAERGYR